MAAWRITRTPAGPHVLARLFAGVDPDHLVAVGDLLMRPEDYADLAARLSPAAAGLIDLARAWRLGECSGTDLIDAVRHYEKTVGEVTAR